MQQFDYQAMMAISIHAPREGGDRYVEFLRHNIGRFQSTPPARGATFHELNLDWIIEISIHAPREGGDYDLTAF